MWFFQWSSVPLHWQLVYQGLALLPHKIQTLNVTLARKFVNGVRSETHIKPHTLFWELLLFFCWCCCFCLFLFFFLFFFFIVSFFFLFFLLLLLFFFCFFVVVFLLFFVFFVVFFFFFFLFCFFCCCFVVVCFFVVVFFFLFKFGRIPVSGCLVFITPRWRWPFIGWISYTRQGTLPCHQQRGLLLNWPALAGHWCTQENELDRELSPAGLQGRQVCNLNSNLLYSIYDHCLPPVI